MSKTQHACCVTATWTDVNLGIRAPSGCWGRTAWRVAWPSADEVSAAHSIRHGNGKRGIRSLLSPLKQNIPVGDDFLRRESDQREDGLRRAAFHPEKSNRLKYTKLVAADNCPPV
ncbi:MAG: hypothetical protein R6U98_09690 [Pirellulaceae bacterium]